MSHRNNCVKKQLRAGRAVVGYLTARAVQPRTLAQQSLYCPPTHLRNYIFGLIAGGHPAAGPVEITRHHLPGREGAAAAGKHTQSQHLIRSLHSPPGQHKTAQYKHALT